MKFAKRISTVAAGLAVLGIAGFTSTGAMAASANGTANATIIDAIAITADLSLEFGTIINGAANTVTVDTAGARTATDATQLAGGTVRAAEFTVTGDPGRAYTVTIPSPISVTFGADSMNVGNFSHNASLTIPGTGSETFQVGGDLSVANGQAAGTYTGTLVVQVNY